MAVKSNIVRGTKKGGKPKGAGARISFKGGAYRKFEHCFIDESKKPKFGKRWVFVFIGDDRYKQTWVLPKNIDKPKRAKDPTKWVDQFLSQAPDIEDLVDDLAGALSECALGDRLQNRNEFYDYIKQRVADASDVQYAAGGAA